MGARYPLGLSGWQQPLTAAIFSKSGIQIHCAHALGLELRPAHWKNFSRIEISMKILKILLNIYVNKVSINLELYLMTLEKT